MLRWSLSTALIVLFLTGCDVPTVGLRDLSGVDAAGSADAAEPDAYPPSHPVPHVDSGGESAPDASQAALKDGAGDGNDAHAIEAGAPDSGPQADAGGDTGADAGDQEGGQ